MLRSNGSCLEFFDPAAHLVDYPISASELSLPRFKSHRASHEINGIIRHAFEELIGKRQIALCDVEECFLLVVAAERAAACEKNVG